MRMNTTNGEEQSLSAGGGFGFDDDDQHGSQDLAGFLDDDQDQQQEGYPNNNKKTNNGSFHDLGGHMNDIFPNKSNHSTDDLFGTPPTNNNPKPPPKNKKDSLIKSKEEGSSGALSDHSGSRVLDPMEDSGMENSGMGDSSGSVSNLRERAAKETKKKLVKKENRAVTCLRFFVLAVLFGTAIGVSIATYLYAKNVEHESFQAEFASVAVVTLRSFVEAVEQSFGSLDAVSSGITSHALRTGETFPNVTIPDFEIKGSTARTQFGSIFMFYLPLVTDETRLGYEEYTRTMQAQLFGSYIQEQGLRLYQDAYFGINASETEAAEARAQAQAEAEAQAAAEAEAAAAAAAAAGTSAGPTTAAGGSTTHTHGEGVEHTHDERQLLRRGSNDKPQRQLKQQQQEGPPMQEERHHHHHHDVDIGGDAPAGNATKEQQRQQQLEAIYARIKAEADAYYYHTNPDDDIDASATTTPHYWSGDAHRGLHVAPPDTGLPPFGHPTIHEKIWGLNCWPINFTDNECWWEAQNTGPYLPMWQLSPTIPMPALVNFNFFDYLDLAPALNQSLNTGRAALSYLQTNHLGSDTEQLIQVFLTLNQYRHRVVNYNADPMTQVNYPVFDNFHPTAKKVTGVLLSAIFWRLLLLDILPEHVEGVICVLSNSLNQSVTYQINGRDAEYLGEGDLHDPKYNDMGQSRDISSYIAERSSVETSSYTTVELDDDYTSYTIHVYPSQTMENSYVTSDPVLYAIVVAFIFVFTSAVFILYDFCVQKRQSKVMAVAVQSSALVTSLFPQSVQDRLFGQTKEEPSEREQNDAWLNKSNRSTRSHRRRASIGGSSMRHGRSKSPFASSLRQSLNDEEKRELQAVHEDFGLAGSSGYMDQSTLNPNQRKKKKGKVIADKYPETTVFFADLAGFTKWSSTREPEQVFELLEALYGSFDRVAIRRAVFKVETIGDCYMAVTGLPNPQPDHAIRAVKFARDCMTRMERILNELQHSLGADTLELGFRVGLHSGPVTAGVLRGDKGRFQLFGDTVNTASRMESNGTKGRIHVSQSTADLLPEKWLTAREDKIVAKGKGEMQTYYVEPIYEARSAYSNYSSAFSTLPSDDNMNKPESQELYNRSIDNLDSIAIDKSKENQDSDVVSELGDLGASDLGNLILDENNAETFENEAFESPKNVRETTGNTAEAFENEASESPKNVRKTTGRSAAAPEPPALIDYSDDDCKNEEFENEGDSTVTPKKVETAPAIISAMNFSKFGDSIAKALKLADEISV